MTDRIVNLRDLELRASDMNREPTNVFDEHCVGEAFGSKATGLSVYEVEPGKRVWPYHFELGSEEWLIVVSGELVLRTPEGERAVRAGDTACFPNGPTGAHAVWNDGAETALAALELEPMTLYEVGRHSFASDWATQGRSIYELSKVMGHASVTTTERYAHLGGGIKPLAA